VLDKLPEHKLEKLPPQSIEAEQAVLGALLVNPTAITRVVEALFLKHFIVKHINIFILPCSNYLIIMIL